MGPGSVFKRCGCSVGLTGRRLGGQCPLLARPGHGSWYFSADLPSPPGERHRVRRGGFRSKAAAAALRWLAGPGPAAGRGLLTREWLWRWLESRVSLGEPTRRGYAAHIRRYLVPYLGQNPLAGLAAGDVQAMFAALARRGGAGGRPVGAATLRRIHATLRAALNGAVRAGLIAVNPARWVELPSAPPPRPLVWTPERVARWEREGWRPVVGVWTPAQTAVFLRAIRGHRLYALFHLVALRGLRRGEACGLSPDYLTRVRSRTGASERTPSKRGDRDSPRGPRIGVV